MTRDVGAEIDVEYLRTGRYQIIEECGERRYMGSACIDKHVRGTMLGSFDRPHLVNCFLPTGPVRFSELAGEVGNTASPRAS